MGERLKRRWADEENHKPKRRPFELQEERSTKIQPGGKLVKGSGCSPHTSRKSDSVGDLFRVESKTTERAGAKSIRIERDWLKKIEAEAHATGLFPALMFGFEADPPEHIGRDDWVAFPASVTKNMVHACAAILAGDMGEARAYASLVMRTA